MAYVSVKTEGQVAVVTIDRPQALNALNTEVLNDLEAAFDAIDQGQVRAVIVTGAGEKSFVAGADIAEMKDFNEAEGKAFCEHGNQVFLKIEQFPCPVIAAVNGFALGGGNELAMACDIRLCSENAMFGQPEVGLGITPGFGGTQRLIKAIGSESKAKEILFTAKNIKAAEAKAIGLVSEVYPQEALMEQALKLASRIAANAPIAVANTKKACDEGRLTPVADGIAIEAKYFGQCFSTEDQKEGMTAFLEKRKEKNFRNC